MNFLKISGSFCKIVSLLKIMIYFIIYTIGIVIFFFLFARPHMLENQTREINKKKYKV